jgi:Glutaredoxin
MGLRLVLVVAIVAVAAIVGLVISRYRRPPHPTVAVHDVGDRPGVVLFTSTTCSTCKDTIALLEDMSIRFREVTNELEPGRFEDWGIVAVPLTVVIDRDGAVTGTFSGVPRRSPLRRALAEAGVGGP